MVDRCPKCQCELKVINGRNVVRNDDTPDVPTKLYRVMTMKCVNSNCPERGKEIEEQIELEIDREG